MDTSKKSVVTMLTSPGKVTLFTITGEVLEMGYDGPHDMGRLVEDLTPQLTGKNAVEVDLNDYLKISAALTPEAGEDGGIVMIQIIDGQEVEGVFYPRKVRATVKTETGSVEIPNVEHLEAHISRASEEKSPSVTNFLKRLAPVIEQRRHSGEDLMQFIKMSEMPLTDDGRIIAYKRVNQRGDGFVDVHSGAISQRIGSRVTMPVDMVDPSRHNSCSTGLHVANLGYLRGFSGTHTLVVLVDPANFIAVPHGETTKARVCSYDVIGVLQGTSHDTVCSGSHVEGDPTLRELIAKAVAGEIKPPFEEVFVGQRKVVNVVPLTAYNVSRMERGRKANGTSLKEDSKKGEKLTKELALAKERELYKDTDGVPPEVQKAFQLVQKGYTKSKVGDQLSTSDRSIGRWMEKWDYEAWAKAHPLTETAPVTDRSDEKVDVYLKETSGDRIGCIKLIRSITGADLKSAMDLVKGAETGTPLKVSIPRSYAEKMAKRFIKETRSHLVIVATGKPRDPQPKAPAPAADDANVGKPKSLRELARDLFNAKRFNELRNFKKKRKKSWDILGFTTEEQDIILKG